jgi:hypothetical protein
MKAESSNLSSALLDSETDGNTFTLKSFSELTGFPIELIKKELLLDSTYTEDTPIPLDMLRKMMLHYLNEAMLS